MKVLAGIQTYFTKTRVIDARSSIAGVGKNVGVVGMVIADVFIRSRSGTLGFCARALKFMGGRSVPIKRRE